MKGKEPQFAEPAFKGQMAACSLCGSEQSCRISSCTQCRLEAKVCTLRHSLPPF